MASNDSTLLSIASKGPVDTFAALASRLRALDAELDGLDGLVWFNRWYAAVTTALVESSRRHRFDDARFVERLECHAAARYFAALTAHLTDPGSGPSCWEPLFQARGQPDVLPIQHAIAGINAHVNHDLPVALVITCGEIDQVPVRGGPAHADYERIGTILDGVLCDARCWLSAGPSEALGPAESAPDLAPSRSRLSFAAPPDATPHRAPLDPFPPRSPLGAISPRAQLEEALSIWSSKRACEAAWATAEVRWALKVSPLISHHHLEALDRMVGLTGRSLLHPWQTHPSQTHPSQPDPSQPHPSQPHPSQPPPPIERRPSAAPSR
jgi:hypothetical protein